MQDETSRPSISELASRCSESYCQLFADLGEDLDRRMRAALGPASSPAFPAPHQREQSSSRVVDEDRPPTPATSGDLKAERPSSQDHS